MMLLFALFFVEVQHLKRLQQDTVGRRAHPLVVSTTASGHDEVVDDRPSSEEDYTLPSLETVLDQDGKVTGDVQRFLYLSIIGFGKCGSTTIAQWLGEHPELQLLKSEVYALVQNDPARLLQRLHRKLPDNLKRGYKCPGDIKEQHVLDFYRTLWPKTKLFIGIRHPVRWFEVSWSRDECGEALVQASRPSHRLSCSTDSLYITSGEYDHNM